MPSSLGGAAPKDGTIDILPPFDVGQPCLFQLVEMVTYDISFHLQFFSDGFDIPVSSCLSLEQVNEDEPCVVHQRAHTTPPCVFFVKNFFILPLFKKNLSFLNFVFFLLIFFFLG